MKRRTAALSAALALGGLLAACGGDSNTNSNANNANTKNTNTRRSSQPAERVTRTVKGQKEIAIDIAALQGKGYPVPVNPNPPEQPEKKDGGGGKRNETSTGAQRRRTS